MSFLAGRSEDSEDTLKQMLAHPSASTGRHAGLCLLASAGIGKSSFGLDIGHRLYNYGACPGRCILH